MGISKSKEMKTNKNKKKPTPADHGNKKETKKDM